MQFPLRSLRALTMLSSPASSRLAMVPAAMLQRAFITVPSNGKGNGSGGGAKELREELESVSRQLAEAKRAIRHLLRLVDKEKHVAALEEMGRHIEGGGAMFVTENAEELEKALQTPGAHIVLLENHRYVLRKSSAVNITRTSVSIIGNNAIIEGTLRMSHNALLDASDVTFISPKLSSAKKDQDSDGQNDDDFAEWQTKTPLPCIEATLRSKVRLCKCTLQGGRDGLYLGIQSEAVLINMRIENCARGLYEGVGCYTHFSRCIAAGNFFHLVLLGRDRIERAAMITKASTSTSAADTPVLFFDTSALGKKQTRADVALDHNPITDTYAVLIHHGERVQLPAALATCGLSDPVY